MELIYFEFYRSQTLELQACFIYYLIYWLVFANLFSLISDISSIWSILIMWLKKFSE